MNLDSETSKFSLPTIEYGLLKASNDRFKQSHTSDTTTVAPPSLYSNPHIAIAMNNYRKRLEIFDAALFNRQFPFEHRNGEH